MHVFVSTGTIRSPSLQFEVSRIQNKVYIQHKTDPFMPSAHNDIAML